MKKNKQIETTFKLTFLGKEPIEITIKAESSIACKISAIHKANLDYPTWLGIEETSRLDKG